HPATEFFTLALRDALPISLVGSAVVVPWREDIRYAIKKNGYHGGSSRQEMIVPLGIWTPPGQTLPEEEYGPAPDLTPAWWEDAGDRKSTRLNSSHVKISYA